MPGFTEADANPEPAPAHRCLRVLPVASLEAMLGVLAPLRAILECAGVAAGPRHTAVAQQLEIFGIPLVVPLGEMQRPPLAWRQGGRSRLAPWLAPGARDDD